MIKFDWAVLLLLLFLQEHLRESLSCRYESELKKLARSHSLELGQVQKELHVCRSRLQEASEQTGNPSDNGGTATNQAHTFAQERTKLVRICSDK